jgi:hypothetical protein
MATEAARLKCKDPRKEKAELTLTGLLMEEIRIVLQLSPI